MIQTLEQKDLREFFSYLHLHISENGKDGSPLFQPQSRNQSGFPKEKEDRFVEGLSVRIGTANWRRAWVYRDASGGIVGHVDLRGRPEPFTSHRALLGMGVSQIFRRRGIGAAMVDHVLQWARNSGVLDVIDLEVLARNEPAVRLYQKAGFSLVCRIEDMFRIDGQSESYVLMTKNLGNAQRSG
jgi:RimJ/RimL family protein N-acetyltransferase